MQRIAAFCDGDVGGSPAGVAIDDRLPSTADMQRIAFEVGASETVFAARAGDGWRVRYFSPEREVAFCGHATLALGAALAMRDGDGVFEIRLNEGGITVEGRCTGRSMSAALQSPPTRSGPEDEAAVDEAMALFGLSHEDLDVRVPPARIHAGNDHLVLMLKTRAALAAMRYDFDVGRALMRRRGWTTVLLGHVEASQRFDVRNAFAWGGVVEDPATGAAAAALAGYLRDLHWPHGGRIALRQGDDIGMPSRLLVSFDDVPGTSIRVSGTAPRPVTPGRAQRVGPAHRRAVRRRSG